MRGQKPFYIVLAVVIVAGVALIATRMTGNHPIVIPANAVITTADTSGFHGYLLGSPTAPVEITEYADFQCPHCADFAAVQWPDVKTRLIDTGKARWRYRDFPIEGDGSRLGASAAACANDQGKFWPVEESLFRRQNDWSEVFHKNPMPVLTDIVKDAGVDVPSWTACMKSAKYAGRIEASAAEGTRLGVKSTPTFFIAGHLYVEVSSDDLVRITDSLIASGANSGTVTAPATGGQ